MTMSRSMFFCGSHTVAATYELKSTVWFSSTVETHCKIFHYQLVAFIRISMQWEDKPCIVCRSFVYEISEIQSIYNLFTQANIYWGQSYNIHIIINACMMCTLCIPTSRSSAQNCLHNMHGLSAPRIRHGRFSEHEEQGEGPDEHQSVCNLLQYPRWLSNGWQCRLKQSNFSSIGLPLWSSFSHITSHSILSP